MSGDMVGHGEPASASSLQRDPQGLTTTHRSARLTQRAWMECPARFEAACALWASAPRCVATACCGRLQARFERARDLLGHSDMTVAQVAELVGYSDARAFRRAFKRWTGVLPHEFRGSLASFG